MNQPPLAPGAAQEIIPGLRRMRFPLPFPPHDVNVWLLEDGAGWTVVDTGADNDATRAAWRTAMAGDAFGGRGVSGLLVTHFHPDHAGLMGWLAGMAGLMPRMTRMEWLQSRNFWFDSGPDLMAHQADFMRAAGAPEPFLDFLLARGPVYPQNVAPLPRAFEAIADGQLLRIGGRAFEIITGQGHAPDMACLHCAEAGVLIAADQVLPRISPYIGLHAAEPMADPLGQFLSSLGKLRRLPEDVVVLPSHGEPFQGLHARLDALAAHHEARLDALAQGCAEPRTPMQLVPHLFRRELDLHNLGYALSETLAHLRRLEALGAIRRDPGADGLIRWQRS